MELPDRELQRTILERLAAVYPGRLIASNLDFAQNDRRWVKNTAYLFEHQLIDAKLVTFCDATPPHVEWVRITAKGIDFLQNDGGLTAILGVVTVRFNAQTLKALIEARVERSDLAPQEKSRIKKWLQQAGSDALKEATNRLVGAALDQLPDAIRLLQTLSS